MYGYADVNPRTAKSIWEREDSILEILSLPEYVIKRITAWIFPW